VRYRNNSFYSQREVVSPTPNPQPGGPRYPLLSGPSPSTCPARVVPRTPNRENIVTTSALMMLVQQIYASGLLAGNSLEDR
jgi:hypothetical protein